MMASCLAIALLAPWPSLPVAAADFSADLPVVREFLDLDKSYSEPERTEAEAAFARLSASAADTTLAAFHLAVAHIAALSRNGHTMMPVGLWPFSFNRIPLRLHVFADGMHVVHAPESMKLLLGARVLAIDGHSTDELRIAFGRYCGAREGKRDEWMGYFVESPELLQSAGLARAGDRLDVDFELADGSRATRTIKATLDAPEEGRFDFLDFSRLSTYAHENIGAAVPFYLEGPRRNFAVTALPALDAVYLQLRVNKDFYEQKVDAFFEEARRVLKAARPTNIVVDLRLDGGGDLTTTRRFFQGLATYLPRHGRIFVLTSGRTFSAGIASAGYLKQSAPSRVTIVGEPIGDHLEFWAEGHFLQLDQSKAALLFASERHNYMTGCQEPDCHRWIRAHPIRVQSLEPDILVPLTYADYRAGRDVALEAVANALKN